MAGGEKMARSKEGLKLISNALESSHITLVMK